MHDEKRIELVKCHEETVQADYGILFTWTAKSFSKHYVDLSLNWHFRLFRKRLTFLPTVSLSPKAIKVVYGLAILRTFQCLSL